MAVQTTVDSAPAAGLVGQMASTVGAEFTSRLAEEAIGEGICVSPGTTNPATTIRLPSADADIDGNEHFAVGVSVLDPYRTAAAYADGEAVLIATKGDMWVTVTNAAVAGGPVFVTSTTGAFDGTTGQRLPNSVFLDAGTGLVRVRLNGPFTLDVIV